MNKINGGPALKRETEMTTTIEDLEARVKELESRDPRKSSRYPYTYACDYMRMTFNIDSRVDAAKAMVAMARHVDDPHHEKIATAFAEAFIAAGHAARRKHDTRHDERVSVFACMV